MQLGVDSVGNVEFLLLLIIGNNVKFLAVGQRRLCILPGLSLVVAIGTDTNLPIILYGGRQGKSTVGTQFTNGRLFELDILNVRHELLDFGERLLFVGRVSLGLWLVSARRDICC
jgi:hypothetical protein